MARSQRLRLSDQRGVFELLGRVADAGPDADAWRGVAVAGLRDLVRGQVAFTADLTGISADAPPQLVRPIDVGWFTDADRARYYHYHASGEVTADPGMTSLMAAHDRARFVTRTRRQLVDDGPWYDSPAVSEARRSARVDDLISSTVAIGHGGLHGFIVYRPWGEAGFDGRDRRVVRLFHLQVLRLLAAGRDHHAGQPATAPLTPRLRQTLDVLLAGHSTKEVAARLGLSFHTVNDYQKVIYRHFRVTSRGELLARHHARPARRPCLFLPAELSAF